jgi:hypothetical protein
VAVASITLVVGCVAGCGGATQRPGDGGHGGTGGMGTDAPAAMDTSGAEPGSPDAAPDQDDDPDPTLCTATKWCDPVVEVCLEDTGRPSPAGVASCGTRWDCYTHFPGDDTLEHPCPVEETDFCGCDGVTFARPWFCADRPYDHIGACGDGLSCDSMRVTCSDPEPTCPEGQVAAVQNGCWGACVPLSMCRCEFHWQCRPRDKYRCSSYPDFRCVPIPPNADGGTDAATD